ncbi:Uma2 family endonuclease [uncultured Thiocystis sp.]|jgi:Uma2 family endonuclease|uniref:Uma2 family endonuclease n=1 Tax=uncultured Thiocystis sp. TaxID=1202134 RepID=UPI0025CC0F82|nr:Uma2 family endonuclease [uncultured Thiocystis sp.]
MDWSSVIADPVLSGLPFKIELNEWGKIVMSPASNAHGMLQTAIVVLLKEQLPSGKAFVECSIQTSKNVKVADVVWCSNEFFRQHGKSTPYTESPEIVVEVASPSNRLAELVEKRVLYFEKGAQEVWICEETGDMIFYRMDGRLAESVACPGFPQKVEA